MGGHGRIVRIAGHVRGGSAAEDAVRGGIRESGSSLDVQAGRKTQPVGHIDAVRESDRLAAIEPGGVLGKEQRGEGIDQACRGILTGIIRRRIGGREGQLAVAQGRIAEGGVELADKGAACRSVVGRRRDLQ